MFGLGTGVSPSQILITLKLTLIKTVFMETEGHRKRLSADRALFV